MGKKAFIFGNENSYFISKSKSKSSESKFLLFLFRYMRSFDLIFIYLTFDSNYELKETLFSKQIKSYIKCCDNAIKHFLYWISSRDIYCGGVIVFLHIERIDLTQWKVNLYAIPVLMSISNCLAPIIFV